MRLQRNSFSSVIHAKCIYMNTNGPKAQTTVGRYCLLQLAKLSMNKEESCLEVFSLIGSQNNDVHVEFVSLSGQNASFN